MKKSKSRIIPLIIIIGLFIVLSWCIKSGEYEGAKFSAKAITRVGILDIFYSVYNGITYKIVDIVYLLVLGGFYGILVRSNSYKKIINRICLKIKDKEKLFVFITSLLLAVYSSITNNILVSLIFVPFIISIILKRGYDKITAFNTSFGAILVGLLGQTFGSYGFEFFTQITKIDVLEGIWIKLLIFVIGYGLFYLFTILHMNKVKRLSSYAKDDLYYVDKATDEEIEEIKKQRTMPTMILLFILLFIVLMSSINWNYSFNIKLFDNVFNSINSFKIAKVSIFQSIIGRIDSFGNWDLIHISSIMVLFIFIIGFINKMKFNNILEYFVEGVKKIIKPVLLYCLISCFFSLSYYFNWPLNILHYLIPKYFSVLRIIIASLFMGILFIDRDYIGYLLGSIISESFQGDLLISSLSMKFALGIVSIIAPTSCLLMFGLSYLDIGYGEWLKHIWKYVISVSFLVVIILCIIAYL